MLFAKLPFTSVVRHRSFHSVLLPYRNIFKCSFIVDKCNSYFRIQNSKIISTKHRLFSLHRAFNSQPLVNMNSTANLEHNAKHICPTNKVYEMKTLDYDLFRKEIQLPYVLATTDQIAKVSKSLKPYFMKMPAFKPVQACADQVGHHRIFLNPDLFNDDTIERTRQLKTCLLPISNSNEDELIGYYKHELTYENFDYHTILRAILPENVDSISGFSTIGHIIHLNLRDEALPYKHIIGQVLMDKVKGCRLVINKLNIIDNKFRNFAMEILAQDTKDPPVNTVVSTTESEIRFKFDFAKVYWNPRLSAERARINKKLLHSVDILYDVFAGVGPFALSTAKFMKCKVLANDLNPESYRWLCENVELNKVGDRVKCFNRDGREFILNDLKNDLIDCIKSFDGSDINRRYHVVMNLPDIAVEFLDTFDGLLSEIKDNDYAYKIDCLNIHCYCFVKNIPEDETRDYVIELASNKLGHKLAPDDVDEVFDVRKVAPNKNMYRISFRLPQDILYGLRTTEVNEQNDSYVNGNGHSVNKRLKIE